MDLGISDKRRITFYGISFGALSSSFRALACLRWKSSRLFRDDWDNWDDKRIKRLGRYRIVECAIIPCPAAFRRHYSEIPGNSELGTRNSLRTYVDHAFNYAVELYDARRASYRCSRSAVYLGRQEDHFGMQSARVIDLTHMLILSSRLLLQRIYDTSDRSKNDLPGH